MAKQRVIGYVDGFNLYFGIKDRGWNQYLWFDPFELVAQVLRPTQELVAVKYFTARIKLPPGKHARQKAYLDALNAHSSAEVIFGKFYHRTRRCHRCQAEWTHHEEKMTDSAIASHIVADAFLDDFDAAVLVGGDTDILPAIKMVRRHFPAKRLEAWFPPKRKNQAVADRCDDDGNINGVHLAAAQMPETIEVVPGISVTKPATWC